MRVRYTSKFKKQYKKLPEKFQQQFVARLNLLLQDPINSVLRDHPLKGKFVGYWSINVNGDLRALYKNLADETLIFSFIVTHSQLY